MGVPVGVTGRSYRKGVRDVWRMVTGARTVAIAGVSLAFALPLVFLLLGSFAPAGQPPPSAPRLLPSSATTANYAAAFDRVDLARQMRNSAILATLVVPASVLVGATTALTTFMARRRTRVLVLAAAGLAVMVPPSALIVGRFTVFDALGMVGTPLPLLAPLLLAATPLIVLLYYWGITRLPPATLEAAVLAGMTRWQLLRWVVFPLLRPITAAATMLAFLATWGGLLDSIIYIRYPENATVPLGLASLAQLDLSDQPILLAAALVATAPSLGLFLLVQGRFLRNPGSPERGMA